MLATLEEEVDAPLRPRHPAVARTEDARTADAPLELPQQLVEGVQVVTSAHRDHDSRRRARRPGVAVSQRTGGMTAEGVHGMRNENRVMELLRQQPGLSDRQIREVTGISPHQQVNQITNRLARSGAIRRVTEDGVYRNYPTEAVLRLTVPPSSAAQADSSRALSPTPPPGTGWEVPALDSSTLVVLPCSGSKRRGGSGAADGPSALDHLPQPLAGELLARRSAVAAEAQLDGSLLMPAAQRYSGRLYDAAAGTLTTLARTEVPAAVISGGYGVVLHDESIGWYDRRLHLGDWPGQLIPRCLATLASAMAVERVVALVAATTDYAKVVRATRWPVEAILLSPRDVGAGAMAHTPRVLGETLRTLLNSAVDAHWRSHGGYSLQAEVLT
jgi:hypothetical protein